MVMADYLAAVAAVRLAVAELEAWAQEAEGLALELEEKVAAVGETAEALAAVEELVAEAAVRVGLATAVGLDGIHQAAHLVAAEREP